MEMQRENAKVEEHLSRLWEKSERCPSASALSYPVWPEFSDYERLQSMIK